MLASITYLIVVNRRAENVSASDLAEKILNDIEEQGILPPVCNVELIDIGEGNFKHSPTERKWDKE